MKLMRAILGAVAVCAGLSFAGCEPEGPLERGGRKVDRSIERAGDKIEDATDRK